MRANTAIAPGQTREGAGFGSTASLVGIRLVQALGWRVGAGALLFAACPLWAVGVLFLSYVDRCFEISKPGRDGVYTSCTNYSAEHFIGWCVLGVAVLFTLGAVGLWKRGGAVRDVELLSEAVEGAGAD